MGALRLPPLAPSGARGHRVGLDIGGTKVHAVLLGPDGAVLADRRAPTGRGLEALVEGAAALVGAVQDDAGLHDAPVAGVGVGVPGLVDSWEGTVTAPVNLGLEDGPIPLASLLSDRLGGVPVQLENDVNAAALGVHALLADGRDLAYLSLGTGLAAGVVLDGVLRRGTRGAAGEIGHLALDPGGRLCACGQRGCLETVASGGALERSWAAGSTGAAARELFTAAGEGDPRARAVVDGFAEGVALAVRVLALAYDPELVVLGGGVASAGPPLLAAVGAALERAGAASAFLRELDLAARLALAPPDAAAVGAGSLAAVLQPRTT